MVVIVVPDEVTDNVSEMIPVIQKMCLGDWTETIKEHHSLQKAIQKGYANAFKIFTPRLVTKLEGANGYAQVRVNQDVVGLILLIRGICCE